MYSASSWCVRARPIAGVSPALGGLATLLAVVFMILFFFLLLLFWTEVPLVSGLWPRGGEGEEGEWWVGGWGIFFFFSRHYSIAVCLL